VTRHGEISGKSATCHGEVADMDHVTGKSQGCLVVSNHRDMFRWFEKFHSQVGYQPVCVKETGKSATSTTKHGEVSNGAEKSMGMSRICLGLFADAGRHREVGIMKFGISAFLVSNFV